MPSTRYEVYSTNPFHVLYEGPFIGAKAFYEAVKDEYFVANQTCYIRVKNSFHFEWVNMSKLYGWTGVVIRDNKPHFHFVVDFDSLINH